MRFYESRYEYKCFACKDIPFLNSKSSKNDIKLSGQGSGGYCVTSALGIRPHDRSSNQNQIRNHIRFPAMTQFIAPSSILENFWNSE